MNTFLRAALLILTIGGGVFGWIICVGPTLAASSLPHMLGAGGALFLYTGIVLAGVSFAFDATRIWPVVAALLVQLVWFSSPGLVYHLSGGLSVWMVFLMEEGPFKVTLGADFTVAFGTHAPWGFGINLVPFALLILVAVSSGARDAQPGAPADGDALRAPRR